MPHNFLLLALLMSSAAAAEPAPGDGLDKAFHRALYKLQETSTGTFRGENPAQRLTFQFDNHDVQLIHPAGRVTFHLSAFGYGDRLQKPSPTQWLSSGNRLEGRRGDLTEWYVNASDGLEQGFTLQRRPRSARTPIEPLTVTIDVAGNLDATQDTTGIIRFGTALRYGGLTAIDARGRRIPSQLKLEAHQIQLLVDDRDAKYPLTIDPTFSQQQELGAPDGDAGNYFGYSVAVSGDTALIGAYGKTVNGNAQQGAAYVFNRVGGVWTLQQELLSPDGAAGDKFGYAVALSGDTAMVAAPYKVPGANPGQGAVYVFTRTGSTWRLLQQLIGAENVSPSAYGYSLSMSGDTAIVGAPFSFMSGGTAYVFVRNGGAWYEQQFINPGLELDLFGSAVAVSGDTAVIGVPRYTLDPGKGLYFQGVAFIYIRQSGAWTQQQRLQVSDPAAYDNFGRVVAIDGDTAVISAPSKTIYGGANHGASYVFVRNSTTWTQQQELWSIDSGSGDLFGSSVALSGDTVLLGASGKSGYFLSSGAAYIFTRSGTSWTQLQEISASDGATSDGFGNAVAMSGTSAIIGAAEKSLSGSAKQGVAYVFTMPAPTTTTLSAAPNPAFFGTDVTLTATVSPSAATGTVTFLDNSTTLASSFLTAGTATVTLSKLTPGAHSLTAAYGGDVNNAGSTSTPIAFTVNSLFTISGQSSLCGSQGPVVLTLSGSQNASTTTDSSGRYTFTGLPSGGSYTVTPSFPSCTFTPASATFTNLAASQTANFAAIPPKVTVSGQVTINGVGVSGALVTVNGSQELSATTTATGAYSIVLPFGGTYKLNASLAPYTFGAPITLSNLTATQTVNFAGTQISGLAFYPVTPCRIADTRTAAGFTGKFGPPALSANTTRAFSIPASACGIPASAAAYSLNFTAIPPAGGPAANLTTWPTTQPTMPNVSTLNYSGTIVANAAIVPAGTDAGINVVANQPTDFLFDINGYFAVPVNNNGYFFVPVTPCRIADTRTAAGFTGPFGPPSMTSAAARSFTVPASGCGIPAGAAAYSLNFTVVPPLAGAPANLTAWPTGQATMPNVSTLNYSGTVVANAAIVPASASGAISIFANQPTEMLFDANGYFSSASGGLKFYPVTPCRIADTRAPAGFTGQFGPPALLAGQVRTFVIPQSTCGIPSAAAYSMNITVVPPASGPLANLTAFPAGLSSVPTVSTLNYSSAVVANAAIVPAGPAGAISLYVNFPTDVLFDINGYFAQ